MFAVRNVALVAAVSLCFAARSDEPLHVYLTWQGDTSTTMTINFQTDEPLDAPHVYYDVESENGERKDYEWTATGATHQIPGLEAERYVHVVELTGLIAGMKYFFIAGDETDDLSDEFSFHTLPNDGTPIRFVTGGDMDVARGARDLLAQTRRWDPMFGLIGGDLAYANGDLRAYRKWDRWIQNWNDGMRRLDGSLVPMILAIGNHEVDGGYGGPKENAPFYFGYFAQGGESHFTRKIGKNAFIAVLDTGHIHTHESQAQWLDEQLSVNAAGIPFTFAVYHVPLYPTHRDFTGGGSVAGRTHWLPVFDKHGLTAAFENHDHTHKRTPPMKGGQRHPEGTVYIGDGCFGVIERDINPASAEYVEVATSTPHFWVVDVLEDYVSYQAVNTAGEVFDTTTTQ